MLFIPCENENLNPSQKITYEFFPARTEGIGTDIFISNDGLLIFRGSGYIKYYDKALKSFVLLDNSLWLQKSIQENR
jgi:hypothetical protein